MHVHFSEMNTVDIIKHQYHSISRRIRLKDEQIMPQYQQSLPD